MVLLTLAKAAQCAKTVNIVHSVSISKPRYTFAFFAPWRDLFTPSIENKQFTDLSELTLIVTPGLDYYKLSASVANIQDYVALSALL